MTDTQKPETKRDRVRRLLIHPLVADGFRKRRDTSDAAHGRFLDRVADNLAYMGDTRLTVLKSCLQTKGEGSARCFWPGFATIIGLAEMLQPRPLEELPGLLSWFASAAGQKAMAENRLVSEYKFWREHKRPPMSDSEWRIVTDRAAQWNRKAERIRERIGRGLPPLADDGDWLERFDARHAYIADLINARQRDAV